MKPVKIVHIAFAVFAGLLPALLFALKTGPVERHTGAPGDQPLACATGGCHTSFGDAGGPINFHGGSVTATFSQNSTYTPGGDPITITVQVTDPVNKQFGFQMTARLDSDQENGQAGSFSSDLLRGYFVLCDTGQPRRPGQPCPASGPVEFVEHNNPATAPWTFTWMPPATNVGRVHFYVAGNAVDGNGAKDGDDHAYTNHYVLDPLGACSGPKPKIDAVISAGSFGARTDFAAGSWLELYGSDFSTVVKEWAAADFQPAGAPTYLDRVRVLVNDKEAFLRFISPGQVNVQAPGDDVTGPVQVKVANCAQTSDPVSLTKAANAPGLLEHPAFKVGGKQFMVATFLDGVTYVGNFAGIPSRPAKPGDIVTTYGIGFGETTPAFAPGTIAAALNSINASLAVTIGGALLPPAGVIYAGLAPGFIGLYQFNFVVPDIPDGDALVTISVGGLTVPQTLYLAVKR